MDVFDAIKTRRSIRSYHRKRVEKAKLLKVLEAARLAPSAANAQPCSFVVVTDTKIKQSLRSAYNREWFISAPVIIAGCVDPRKGWAKGGEEYWSVDIAIAMQNLILAAWDQGLGTCWVGAFNEQEVRRVLGIPKDVCVVAMTPLGYPAEHKGPVTDRKPLKEIVHYDRW